MRWIGAIVEGIVLLVMGLAVTVTLLIVAGTYVYAMVWCFERSPWGTGAILLVLAGAFVGIVNQLLDVQS